MCIGQRGAIREMGRWVIIVILFILTVTGEDSELFDMQALNLVG
jgi:hypothetical protein